MKKSEQILSFRERPIKEIILKIPTDVFIDLGKVACYREITEESLIKLYIGNGLRQDLAKIFLDEETP